jgi:hypothetical protein
LQVVFGGTLGYFPNFSSIARIIRSAKTTGSRIAQFDAGDGAWIYFETNEPIGRSHARHPRLIQSLLDARRPETGGPHGEA